MNGLFGLLLSALNRKIFYVFVLSHAGAECHSGYNCLEWADLVCVGVMEAETVENNKDYSEADSNGQDTTTTCPCYRSSVCVCV